LRESMIWKLVVATILFTGILMLVSSFDKGFFNVIQGGAAIAVSTGNRIELVVTQRTPVSQEGATEIYSLEKDGSLKKYKSFEGAPMCVTAFAGRLFLGFFDDGASIFKDGQWERGVTAPPGLTIYDVGPIGDRVYAFGPVSDSRKVGVQALGETGWEEAAQPLDTGKKNLLVTCADVAGGIEVLYGTGQVGYLGTADVSKFEWFHVRFDGKEWGVPKPLDLGGQIQPQMSSYKGEPAFVFTPVKKNEPVKVAVLDNDKLKTIAEIQVTAIGVPTGGWLVALGDEEHLILSTIGAVWDVRLDGNLKFIDSKRLIEVSSSSRARTNVYVGLFAVVAVVLVSLGIAWFLVRLRGMRGGEEG
jgi:hypothetical protein